MNINRSNRVKRVHFGVLFLFSILFNCTALSSRCMHYSFMWYNVENLFDIENDSLKNDNEFLPQGLKHWTYNRYLCKLNNIACMATEIDSGKLPTFMAFCEVENRKVLKDLNYKFFHNRYSIIHFESPDQRGIDVALLYRKMHFTIDTCYPIHVELPSHHSTRDILFVSGTLVRSKETLNLFILHAPSKRGGVKLSAKNRKACLNKLFENVDNLMKQNHNMKIVIIGDFNAQINEKCMSDCIDSLDKYHFTVAQDKNDQQSYFYHGIWGSIDHMLHTKSSAFSNDSIGAIYIKDFKVFAPCFAKRFSNKYLDSIPYRTYNYIRYLKGYSDHFPLFFRIEIPY